MGCLPWLILSDLVFAKLKVIGLGSHGHVQKSRNHGNDGFSDFPKRHPKRLLVENEAESFYRAFELFF